MSRSVTALAAAGRWLPGPMNLCSFGYFRVSGQPTPVTERNHLLTCPLLASCGCLLTRRVKLQPVRHKYVNMGNYKLTGEAAMTASWGIAAAAGSDIWQPRSQYFRICHDATLSIATLTLSDRDWTGRRTIR
jgi:hypothetical protein